MPSIAVIDRSRSERLGVSAALSKEIDISILGELEACETAGQRVAGLDPDLVLIGLHPGRARELELAGWIMKNSPRPILALTGAGSTDPLLAFRAMSLGVLEVCPRPPSPDHPSYPFQQKALARLIRVLANVPVVHRIDESRGSAAIVSRAPSASPGTGPSRSPRRAELVAIGASTGGPPVLSEILRALPRNFDTPIVVVQHMTAGFTRDFARWLAETAQRRTLLVDSPLSLEAGAIYLAADDSHLVVVSRTKLAPERSAARGFQRPSVDVLFESAAAVFGAATIGVLLTGMGRDGVEGMMTLKRKGALTIVQTPSTCAVDAMPRAAIERDAVDMVASPGEIASLISSKISSTPARVCGEKR